MQGRRDRLVLVIGVFKLLKAGALLALGLKALVNLPEDLAASAERVTAWAGAHAGRGALERGVAKIGSLDERTVHRLAAISLAYGAVFLVEGVGLVTRRRWAEWLTVIVTGSFIPFEVMELAKEFTAPRLSALVVNFAILVYLAWRRIGEIRKRRGGRGARSLAVGTMARITPSR